MDSLKLFQPVRATAAALWHACATPEGLANWQADRVSGHLRPGEQLVLAWPALGAVLNAQVDAVEPERAVRLRFEGTRLRLGLVRDGVELEVKGIPTFDADAYRLSWELALAQLAFYAENHVYETRQTHWAVQPCRAHREAAYLAFTDAQALKNWLGTAAATGVGPPAKPLFDAPARDVAWAPAQPGSPLLVLRTLPGPDAGELLLIAIWSAWDRAPLDETLRKELDSALVRLRRWLQSPEPS